MINRAPRQTEDDESFPVQGPEAERDRWQRVPVLQLEACRPCVFSHAPANPLRMGAKKISKKTSRDKAAAARRQGAVPCLIIAGIVLLLFAFVFFAALRNM
jgi:hypothetical protein